MAADDFVYEGHQTTPEEKFFVEWGYETLKKSVDRLQDGLQRLGAFGTTLLGGSIYFLKDDVCAKWWRIAACGLLLISVVVALIGSLPKSDLVRPGSSDLVREQKEKLLRYRSRFLLWATIPLPLALAVAVIGSAVAAAKKPPTVIEEREPPATNPTT